MSLCASFYQCDLLAEDLRETSSVVGFYPLKKTGLNLSLRKPRIIERASNFLPNKTPTNYDHEFTGSGFQNP